jgi:hypothetical protein
LFSSRRLDTPHDQVRLTTAAAAATRQWEERAASHLL